VSAWFTGAVLGEVPASSVLNINCRAHAYDNLYVVDSSFMPGMGAVNLTLTIIANAMRVSDRIREGMGYKANVNAATRPRQMVPREGTTA